MDESNLVYLLDEKVYVNLTNLCTNDCLFCIRSLKNDVAGSDMRLKSEDITPEDVITQLDEFKDKLSNGVIFCGYGEPTIKLDVLTEVAKYIKTNYPNVKIRVNTNGHGNAIHKRDITLELKGLVDEFSISLNAQNETLYNKLSQPKVKDAYNAVKEFAQAARAAGIATTMSVVTGYENYDVDILECEKIAVEHGAKFRRREWLDSGY